MVFINSKLGHPFLSTPWNHKAYTTPSTTRDATAATWSRSRYQMTHTNYLKHTQIRDICEWAHWRHTCPNNPSQAGHMKTDVFTRICARLIPPLTTVSCNKCHKILHERPQETWHICVRTTPQLHLDTPLTTRTPNIHTNPDGTTMIYITNNQTQVVMRPRPQKRARLRDREDSESPPTIYSHAISNNRTQPHYHLLI